MRTVRAYIIAHMRQLSHRMAGRGDLAHVA
jgi:hypothetical protein